MEKIVDDYIKSTSLMKFPLSKNQFAYQSGKSTITALQSLVSKIEKSLQAKEIALVAFLDIEGAFDNASYSSMRSAMQCDEVMFLGNLKANSVDQLCNNSAQS